MNLRTSRTRGKYRTNIFIFEDEFALSDLSLEPNLKSKLKSFLSSRVRVYNFRREPNLIVSCSRFIFLQPTVKTTQPHLSFVDKARRLSIYENMDRSRAVVFFAVGRKNSFDFDENDRRAFATQGESRDFSELQDSHPRL